MAVYDDAERPKTTSRLIVAYENGRLCELPSDGLPFPTLELLPERFRHGARRSLLVQALFFEQRQIGFVLFELGAKRRLRSSRQKARSCTALPRAGRAS